MDLDHRTGAMLDGWPAVVQSILIILSTRINTRVFLREFGSEVPKLVDAPQNEEGILSLYMAVAEALAKWEPRFELTNVEVAPSPDGAIILDLSGNYRPHALSGDVSTVTDEVRVVRVVRGEADEWSLQT
ncbi:hypothetical protein HGE74_07800 [Rhodobacteraceae bacterium R_SAG1]|uniref:GPW/gp25 family protein n=1 Tax=Phaeobacter italicus TaxID=481446 RepID=UPI00144880C3|nr:GPW/gp25 family protein [Phaeobacter italicus]MBY6045807.1 GPW/gp25 family protein [Phaeobacter italicus]NKX71970.1 hypothetical protein [Rhodobacteraceae bacterium R_SAG1]